MKVDGKYLSLFTAGLSFWSGMAGTLDIGSNLYTYNDLQNPEETDRKALAQDWFIVGNDIWGAINNYEQTQ